MFRPKIYCKSSSHTKPTYRLLGGEKDDKVFVERQHRVLCYPAQKLLQRSHSGLDKFLIEPIKSLQAVFLWQWLRKTEKENYE